MYRAGQTLNYAKQSIMNEKQNRNYYCNISANTGLTNILCNVTTDDKDDTTGTWNALTIICCSATP